MIRAETNAYLARDADGWQATWLHEAKSTRALVSNNSYNSTSGWKNFGPDMVERLKANPTLDANLNSLSSNLLRADKAQEAIEVLKANVRLHPQSAGAYEMLGEAYAIMGNNDLAIENYEKSVQLNPGNERGKQALAKLKQ